MFIRDLTTWFKSILVTFKVKKDGRETGSYFAIFGVWRNQKIIINGVKYTVSSLSPETRIMIVK